MPGMMKNNMKKNGMKKAAMKKRFKGFSSYINLGTDIYNNKQRKGRSRNKTKKICIGSKVTY